MTFKSTWAWVRDRARGAWKRFQPTLARLRERAADFVRRWSQTDELSWWGHAIQGVVITLFWSHVGIAIFLSAKPYFGPTPEGIQVAYFSLGALFGPVATVNAFGHREIDDFVVPWLEEGWGVAMSKLRRDGLMDFMAPYLASMITYLVIVMIWHARDAVVVG